MIYTIIDTTYSDNWSQWFAGLTDGDGCFYISKKEGSVSFEITTHTTDARVLYNIKNKLKAGSVRLRSNSESVRYRVKQKTAILDIVYRLNGKLHYKARIAQYAVVCELLNVQQLPTASILKKTDAYLSGLIDSDGSFAISVAKSSAEDSQISGVAGKITRLANSKGHSQLSLKVTSIDKDLLIFVQKSYGFGSIYIQQANKKNNQPNIIYHWTIKSYHDFQCLYEYLKKNPLKSVKMHRMRLSLLYFKYKDLGYHLKPEDTIESKIWAKFCKSWFKYSY
uniref:hypothetical protein n=1 Tax=Parallela transversalis TaxID=163324 RepID=UPI0010C5204D|nr:hypothetical protein [Parallela transversalis]AYQ22871.1 hypothetical protein [Parallela transversalis]